MKRGTRVGQAYIGLMVDGDGINEEIVDSVDEAGPGVEKAGKDHGERYSEGFDEGSRGRLGKIADRWRGAAKAKFSRAGSESGQEFSKGFEDHFDNSFLDRLGAHVGGHFVDALNHAVSREGGDGPNPLADLFDKWMEGAVSGNGGGKGGRRGSKDMGDRIGRLFGAGSRNNFFNLFGKTLGGIVGLVEKVASSAGKMFTVFYKGFTQAAEGANFLQKTMSGFSEIGMSVGKGGAGLMASIAESGPAAVVAILAIVAAMTIMVSVVGSLIALVTALAATIASALTGAVLIAAGAFSALGAAVGLAVVAFTSMTDAQRKLLSDAFRPLKAELTGIGQIMLQQMVPAFSVWSANLQQALMLAVPVAQVMGQAFAQAGNIITESLSGPGFQMFSQALTTYLPGIVTSLSEALGSFLNGLMAVFAALMPYVSEFSVYLARVAAEFSDWATSAQGQNAITNFVDRAVVSIQSLWNFITSFSGFLFDVLFSPEAMNAGNTIFDGMAATFQHFSDIVARAAADGSLQRWFDDAIQFGSQLWSVIEALGGTFIALYDSGVITAIGDTLGYMATVIGWLNKVIGPLVSVLSSALPAALGTALGPIGPLVSGLIHMGDTVDWVMQKVGLAVNSGVAAFNAGMRLIRNASSMASNAGIGSAGGVASYSRVSSGSSPSLSSLQHSGMAALNATSRSHGGYKPPKPKSSGVKQYHNPYVAYANSLIKEGASTKSQIKAAMVKLQKAVLEGVAEAGKSTGGWEEIHESFNGLVDQLHAGGKDVVSTARNALNSAAQSLASAGSASAARAALKKVHAAQKNLRDALKSQDRLNALAKNISAQQKLKWTNLASLMAGLKTSNVTLAEFAEARQRIAVKIEAAQQKLDDAISMRDDFKQSVTQSISTFASLASAQAKTIDGVEQALTANDLTSNLQDKLTQIQKFQSDLKLLVAQGLSNDAYKQIVDEGVVNGTAIADALLAGGASAIQNTNSLVQQVNDIAATLGAETSTRMYQAGVDAAQGLLAGLKSLDAQLAADAAKLGDTIAKSIKKSLGIKSPSTVLRDLMGYVGDGAVLGLQDQHVKVGSAASALANLIAVNPGGPPANGGPPVSGNTAPLIGEVNVHTPTEDPKAVALETVNELVGRL